MMWVVVCDARVPEPQCGWLCRMAECQNNNVGVCLGYQSARTMMWVVVWDARVPEPRCGWFCGMLECQNNDMGVVWDAIVPGRTTMWVPHCVGC